MVIEHKLAWRTLEKLRHELPERLGSLRNADGSHKHPRLNSPWNISFLRKTPAYSRKVSGVPMFPSAQSLLTPFPEITERYDHSFIFGDLNFRLDVSRLHADWLIGRKGVH